MINDYQIALDYLYRTRPYGKIKYGLYRIEELLDRLGNPQEQYPTVHIAGTNGKGSVAVLLKAISQAHGLRTGLNISPHVVSFRERIQIDGEYISEEDVCDTLNDIIPHLEQMDSKGYEFAPSFFEVVTAMTFQYFFKQRIDLAIIEVGLGGRLDASNILKRPAATVITSVALDHMNILGKTEEEIAFEKSGIIKPLSPVVSGITRPAIRHKVQEKADELSAPVSFIDRDFGVSCRSLQLGSNLFDYWGDRKIVSLETALNGVHQVRNCGIAINAFGLAMSEIGRNAEEGPIRKALRCVRWPGRFEIFEQDSQIIILDGGHNPDAARNLRESLQMHFPGHDFDFVFGSLDDKDYASAIRLMAPIARNVYVSRIDNHRSKSPERVFDKWLEYTKNVRLFENSRQALTSAIANSNGDPLVCWGSLYLVSELRAILTGRYEYAGRH